MTPTAAWEALATEIAMHGDALAAARTGRLQALTATLGLSAGDVETLTPEDAEALLACAASLDPLARGHVWLLAYERHYREQIRQERAR